MGHARIVAAGNLVDGPDPVWPNSIRVATAEEARNVVRSQHGAGADFIKVSEKAGHCADMARTNSAVDDFF